MIDISKYAEQIVRYKEIIQKISELEQQKDLIRQNVAELLHQDQKNEQIVELENKEFWFCGYQTTSRTSTDLKLLLEYVGPAKYNEIVTEKSSTFLTIRKSSKSKSESKLLKEKPVDEEQQKPIVPTGVILS
jgi:hypothetical protein